MATLTVNQTTDFSADVFSPIVTLIDFTNRRAATATFAASQFDDINISSDVAIDGSVGTNNLKINDVFIFDASGWTFTNWSATDSVTLNGTSGSDIIAGTSQADLFNTGSGGDELTGGGGADHFVSGDGDDAFLYKNQSEIQPGETIDGGADIDTIALVTNLTMDFSAISIVGVEQVEFRNALGGFVTFGGNQIGGGGITTVIGSAANTGGIKVLGSAIDVSGVSFINLPATGTPIVLQGVVGASNVITGSSLTDRILGQDLADTIVAGDGNDLIRAGAGADDISGGNGDDTFEYSGSASQAAAGEIVNGEAGIDTISLENVASIALSGVVISGIEKIKYTNGNNTAQLLGTQIGGQASRINTIDASANTDGLSVTGTAVNLSGVTFNNWSATDVITIAGSQVAANTLVGTAFKDTITGGNLADTIKGGGGGDVLNGDDGIDTLSYGGSAAGVSINLALNTASGGDAQGDTIALFENVLGGNQADTLIGNTTDNLLNGAGGNDIITGDRGLDTLIGGGGNDTFKYVSNLDAVAGELVNGGGGALDTIELANSVNLTLDNLNITGVERLKLNSSSIALVDGDDLGVGGITTVEAAGTGGVLVATGSAIDLSGIAFVNWSASQSVSITGTEGDDIITGSSQDDSISTSEGNDTVSGGGGDDTIQGSLGKDLLSGGVGLDLFVFGAPAESPPGAAQRDVIGDFNVVDDTIGLEFSGFSTFIGTGQFTGTAGEVRFATNAGSNFTIVSGDSDGDAVADFQLELTGIHTLTSADFIF